MRRTLLATTGAVLAVLTLLSTAAATRAASVTDETSDAVGPPGGLSDQVPDFVASILDAIGQFVDGVIEGNPGEELSDSAGDGVAGET